MPLSDMHDCIFVGWFLLQQYLPSNSGSASWSSSASHLVNEKCKSVQCRWVFCCGSERTFPSNGSRSLRVHANVLVCPPDVRPVGLVLGMHSLSENLVQHFACCLNCIRSFCSVIHGPGTGNSSRCSYSVCAEQRLFMLVHVLLKPMLKHFQTSAERSGESEA